MRQVVIIPKKLNNISEISPMLLLNYWTKIWNKITQDNKSMAGWTKKRALTTWTKTMLEKNFVRTKGHLPPSRILPTCFGKLERY